MLDSGDLYFALLPCLPSNATSIVKTYIDVVSELPGLEDWRPKQINYSEALKVIRLGHSLSRLISVGSFDPIRLRIAEAIRLDQEPNPSDMAEVDGAALCIALNAISLEKIRPKQEKIPDLIVSWPTGEAVDVEVTCARTKPIHVERQEIAFSIAEEIDNQSKDRAYDVILHSVNLGVLTLPTILSAVRDLEAGKVIEEVGEWQLRAEMPKREHTTVFVAGSRDEPPHWWPPDIVAPFVFRQHVAGPNAITAPPQVRITYGVPVSAYVNPVQNKADKAQGGSNPFLVAVDVGNLPGVFSVFSRELPKYLDNWTNVSGVLAFHSFIGPSEVGWFWQLTPNPHSAALPILLDNQFDLNQQMKTAVLLRQT